MELVLLNQNNTSKRLDTSETTTNLKNTFYEDNEIQDIMKKFYQIEINLTISILFPIQHNCILSRRISI